MYDRLVDREIVEDVEGEDQIIVGFLREKIKAWSAKLPNFDNSIVSISICAYMYICVYVCVRHVCMYI